jgi:hypothetical protein
MSVLSEGPGASAFRRAAGAIARRWWLIAGIVALVGVGASLTQLSAVTSPPYTESATLQIVAMPSGASSYDGYAARSRAETAAENVASDLVTSSSDLATSSSLGAAQYTLAIVHAGDTVTLTVHAATKADAERVLSAALVAVTTDVANGEAVATGGPGADAQLRVQVTSAPAGAAVDRAAQQAGWRDVIERLALALALGVALAVAAWRWEGGRSRGATGTPAADGAPDGGLGA